MAAEYDEQGNYIYPEGFDPETNEWLEGYEEQREEWERQYAEAQARCEAHKKQVEEAAKADAEAARRRPATPTSYSSATGAGRRRRADARPRRAAGGRAAPSPPTRRSPRCARSYRQLTATDDERPGTLVVPGRSSWGRSASGGPPKAAGMRVSRVSSAGSAVVSCTTGR